VSVAVIKIFYEQEGRFCYCVVDTHFWNTVICYRKEDTLLVSSDSATGWTTGVLFPTQ